MTIDESNQIEELLGEWYAWQAGYTPGLGYGRVDPTCRGFSESDRTITADERAEAADRNAARRRAEQVDLCVDALSWQERAAIQRHMKAKQIGGVNGACGAQVWSDPRKSDLSAAHVDYQSAKEALYPFLVRKVLVKIP
ncbi:hypothetical protein WK90_32680 [Burkholderia cepacia]|uniref:hypothetical protein n=1 Tax=Burkholderia cepacia TaxID=292 RepID=UPI00075F583F|nr:hypothetical protein [Burkholderia cepacia]KVV50151.1 hypothetical protein WK83_32510 [Burkholderia cepacia]KVV67374.1 hypothetical protein WK85_24195 [Burkholderia cepacia]KVV70644.1 hypothetical protein WK84_13410 [Burkholderia cepacia]KVV77051.1 hypothetical protein WK87_34450 [Burkholderia cepacia]KVV97551.1 hypothetical protein WK88_00235 [Burkholderia cepacia]